MKTKQSKTKPTPRELEEDSLSAAEDLIAVCNGDVNKAFWQLAINNSLLWSFLRHAGIAKDFYEYVSEYKCEFPGLLTDIK